MQETKAQVAILYPGEMGAALAGVLVARGYRVVTTLAHRGDATGTFASHVGPSCQSVASAGAAPAPARTATRLIAIPFATL